MRAPFRTFLLLFWLSQGTTLSLWGQSLQGTSLPKQKLAAAERSTRIRTVLTQLSQDQLPGLQERADVSLAQTSLSELLRGIAETHQLNIHVDPRIQASITNNFTQVAVQDLLVFLCEHYQLDLQVTGTILSVVPLPEQPPELQVSYQAENDRLTVVSTEHSLGEIARQITEQSPYNVLVPAGLRNRPVSTFLKEAPFARGLAQLGQAEGLTLSTDEEGFFVFVPPDPAASSLPTESLASRTVQPRGRPNLANPEVATGQLQVRRQIVPPDTLLYVQAQQAALSEVIARAAEQAGVDFLMLSTPEGTASCQLQGVSFAELLSKLLEPTQHHYYRQGSWYVIGERQQQGLRYTELLTLQYRTVDSLQYLVPEEMKVGVTMQEFQELNSLILSGSAPQIAEIKAFIQALDRPVPNVLIEVIVATFRKGVGVQTGIQAYLADSVPSTGGQVFPGLDVTLSSKGINGLLEKLDSKGFINLGRVSPRFYVTLQALENNNLIDIRSTPKLATLNGHAATLTIGESRFFLEETQNITGGVTPINSVTQRFLEVEANLQINVRPVVSGDEHVTLQIEAEFSDFIEPEQPGFPPGSATRQFLSQIRVQNEEMIVLGGLEEVGKTQSSSGVPVLSRIPVLKWLFSSRSKNTQEDRLIVFIKPTIVY